MNSPSSEIQCSSASRKFLNLDLVALKRRQYEIQCSSASRKFLNRCGARRVVASGIGFSALQRAENSSIRAVEAGLLTVAVDSVLFSEPKIPQSFVDPPDAASPE